MLQVIYLSLLICFLTQINGYPQPLECDCQNGGECILLPNGEQGCSCEPDFVGDKCEYLRRRSSQFRINDNDYKIQVLTLMIFTKLKVSPNEIIFFKKCHNNGSVYYDKSGKLRCKCSTLSTGAKCEFMLPTISSLCAPNPCFNGGFCAEIDSGFRCTCPPSYTGLMCENEVGTPSQCGKNCDPCGSNNPCAMNGVCANSSCNAICVCKPFWTGTFCDTPLPTVYSTTTTTSTSTTSTTTTTPCPTTQCDPCAISPCNQHGQCYNYSCIAYCECYTNYTGTFCDVQLEQVNQVTTTSNPFCNPCALNKCSNNGECFSLSCEAYCVCNPGYTGDNCDAVMPFEIPSTTPSPCGSSNCNPCAQNPCSQNGVCQNISCSAYCQCNIGYTGTFCDILLPTTAITVSTTAVTTVSTTSVITPLLNRCNFSIGLFNDGAFTTRFKIEYRIDGIKQAILTSASLPIIGQSTYNTIPYYATDIIVTIEVLGWNWFTVKEDTGIQTNTYCTKCYKTWGTVTGVNIDYVKC